MSEFLSFHLSDDFVEQYADREVNWGFPIHKGLSLGELTYISKYSRIKEDGTKERWHETCRRIIEGMFSIQKDWCQQNRTSWNDHKAQRAAKDAYERLFTFKWTPPGRGMWAMGTSMVHDGHNSAALYNCFTGDTQFVTDQGTLSLEEALGKDVKVLSSEGWKKASVEYFGKQSVQTVTLVPAHRRRHRTSGNWFFRAAPSSVSHQVEVTPDHRWLKIEDANGVEIGAGNDYPKFLQPRTETTDLSVGDILPAIPMLNYRFDDEDDRYVEGQMHGVIFGDGTLTKESYKGHSLSRFAIAAYGDRAQALCAEIVEDGGTDLEDKGDKGDHHRYEVLSDVNLKAFPSPSETPAYLAGFIDGWLSADGHKADGTWVVDSTNEEALQWLTDNGPAAGWVVTGYSQATGPTNYTNGEDRNPMWRIKIRKEAYWKVHSIESSGKEADVYCAVVPGPANFTLAGGIHTGNCAWLSTEKITAHSKYEATLPFVRLMEMSMWGIGVGFDTRGAGKITLQQPEGEEETFVVPDTREGWAESVGKQLTSYFLPNQRPVVFDYDEIRPAGAPLKTFGGTASGPGPLMALHEKVDQLIGNRHGESITSRDIVDIQNLIGKAVVAGGARRSAELALGDVNDEDYINLKNYNLPVNGERTGNDGWAWMSNNSVYATVESDLDHIIESIEVNGEPGIVWMDVARKYGRLADPVDNKDEKATGVNPCAEIILESHELCCLAETYINNADDVEDFLATCKVAMLYAKTVTLLPTPWAETNEVIVRNRRIGVSKTGTAQFAEQHGWNVLKEYDVAGYDYICEKDRQYSEWLGVRESIRKTTSKPAGSTSLLAGCAPGIHWPTNAGTFLRRSRFHVSDPIIPILEKAGYNVEPDEGDPKYTVVAEFPVTGLDMRSEHEVSIWEKAELAAFTQRWWADNAVSVTVSFQEEERGQIKHLLRSKAGQFKTISFLPPLDTTGFAQAPFEVLAEEDAAEIRKGLKKVSLKKIYDGGKTADAVDTKFCDGDTCELPFNNVEGE